MQRSGAPLSELPHRPRSAAAEKGDHARSPGTHPVPNVVAEPPAEGSARRFRDDTRETTVATTTLLDLLMNLLKDPAEQQAFLANPTGYLQECGLADLSPEDIKDAVTLAADSPHHDWDGHGQHDLPPAPPVHHHHDDSDHHDPHTEAADYLKTYITNTFVDDRRTFIDQSFHQDIDTHGGDVDPRLRPAQAHPPGGGSVAVGGDNRAPVATGDHAVAGWGNDVVNGDDDAASFGSGAAVDQSGA